MDSAWTMIDWALLLLRVTTGIIFMAHGWPKAIANIEKHAASLRGHGFPFPRAMSILVGWLELAGGFLIMVGILVEPLSAVLAVVLGVAIFKFMWKKGFVGASDFPLLQMVVCVVLALAGPGAIAPALQLW